MLESPKHLILALTIHVISRALRWHVTRMLADFSRADDVREVGASRVCACEPFLILPMSTATLIARGPDGNLNAAPKACAQGPSLVGLRDGREKQRERDHVTPRRDLWRVAQADSSVRCPPCPFSAVTWTRSEAMRVKVVPGARKRSGMMVGLRASLGLTLCVGSV